MVKDTELLAIYPSFKFAQFASVPPCCFMYCMFLHARAFVTFALLLIHLHPSFLLTSTAIIFGFFDLQRINSTYAVLTRYVDAGLLKRLSYLPDVSALL